MNNFGFGMMRLPQKTENQTQSIDMEMFKQMADLYLKEGFTYFDTGYPYHAGKSETAFGEIVAARYPRDAYSITDKLPIFIMEKKEDIPRIFEEQLARCGVSYFDYYLLHGLGQHTYKKAVDMGAFEFVAEMKAQGKIKHAGFSFHDTYQLLDTILSEHPEMEAVQLQLNYIDWDSASVQARQCYETAVKYQKPVIVMEPVKGGSLANIPGKADEILKKHNPEVSASSWALRFAASLDNVTMVLSGMSDIAQLRDNIKTVKEFTPLSSEEYALIDQVKQIIKSNIAIPCTECRYCVDDCPQHIAIPEYFALYNNLKRFDMQHPAAAAEYAKLNQENGKASECIECGRCEELCPQHLPIRSNLKEAAEVLERRRR